MSEDYNAMVEPVIQKLVPVRGFVQRVTENLCSAQGRTVARQQVDRWLHRNRNKRVEPGYTTAIQLMEAVESARKAMEL
jgi:hypothetical protein